MSKANYVGTPAIFQLELCCRYLNGAFPGHCYLVGSATERPDWRDVDVRMIAKDDEFCALFPDADPGDALFQYDARWIIMNTGIAMWLRQQTGLPIDFQIQPQTFANAKHDKPRHAMGFAYEKREFA